MRINKPKFFNILLVIVAITGCVCIVTAGMTWYRKVSTNAEWKEVFTNLKRELEELKLPPTTRSIFAMRREYEWLLEQQEKIWGLLEAKRLPINKLSPLEFKEELLNTDTKLRQLARIQGSELPQDLGFPEYAGGQIPLASEVVLLNKQLAVINEIVSLLLKHKVEDIIAIERLPYIYYSEGNLYEEIAFRIETQCILEDLLRVLADLPKTSFFTVVRSIKLDKVDENRVKAELLVGVVEFGE